ncbi:uncharacterized protein TRIADDRAFT_60846 [Trichoplax adhaerens]|uniref:Uncharacterized protein n=1 Tax=Trichoplax adhaerens TaxID=10228 RepID=B3S9B5_TRIAD|nr:hypothetical protein TRIADDRAFT_60846 [Trichoplax adhaerens]EDV20618.1 hypothetical protein TRIADDRAFT_60846 [Trichoplax adhaerens]|eukprot:XP_002116818.1 hypothetical protein TRIADDRAFT_60846 [Trichoplax adhaerens]
MAIAYTIKIRTLLSYYILLDQMPEGLLRFVTFCMVFLISVCMFVQTIWADRSCAAERRDSERSPNPESEASFISQILFWWMNGIMMKGFKNPLTEKDLWDLNDHDKSDVIGMKFSREWQKEMQKSKKITSEDGVIVRKGKGPSLVMALTRAYGGTFLLAGLMKLVQDMLVFVNPQLLRQLIAFTADKSIPTWTGFAYTFLLFGTAFVQSCVLHQYFHGCLVTGMRIRSGVIWAVYRKALVLSNSARKKSTVGEIVNLMSVDAQRFMDLMTFLHIIWSAPFQIAVSMYFLWDILGPSVMAGLAVLILMIPINAYVSTKARVFQVKQMKLTDERIKTMNEILNGVKVLKLYAWEKSFIAKVLSIRSNELKQLLYSSLLNAVGMFAWGNAPFLVALATFSTYVLTGNELNAEKAFVGLSLFNILRFPIGMLPAVISSIIQASVSVKRLSNFLENEELDPNSVERVMPPKYEGNSVIIEDGTFNWEREDKKSTLSKINIKVKTGSLVAIVGHVGSGKSSLLSALLGEMEKMNGSVYVKGSVAYVPQQAWMKNASLEENILFGNDQFRGRYSQCVDACALKPDLEMLPGGDQTEIGEKGINLSGGQKQRVSLARAVYSNSDVYMLDDPLSAVDAHVGKHIFENVIGHTGMLRHKTRLFVTHAVGFLPYVDHIIVLEDGEIVESGSYNELLSSKGAFADFLTTYAHTETNRPDDEIASTSHLELPDGSHDRWHRGDEDQEMSRRSSKGSRTGSLSVGDNDSMNKLSFSESSRGRVKFSVFTSYLRSWGWIPATLVILFYFASEGLSVGANVWLAQWSVIVNSTAETRDLYLGVYGAFGGCRAFVTLLTSVIGAVAALNGSRSLHRRMLERVLHAPMSFFDTTPLGRVVNRFSKDMNIIDEIIPRIFNFFLIMMTTVLSTLVVISVSTPIFMAVIVPLMILYIFTQRFYIATSRQLKRLESVSRSPIFSHFGETVQGATTIRGYRVQDRFFMDCDKRVDVNQMAYYPYISSNRWLAIRLEFVGNCIVMFAAVFAVVGRGSNIPAGIVGLSITYALQITQTLNMMVRMTGELEANIVAVERVQEYSNIDLEAPWEIEDSKPDDQWPKTGEVRFMDYKTRYRANLDLVLKGIDCVISGGEKIGIVGRTGAGKSSLTLGLFRIIESAGGSIVIDGVDISKVGLHNLRSRISIIPQDPVLFSGSIRMNLDPFEDHNDEEIWSALEHAHLKTFISSLEDQLQFQVSEGGDNLSVGQRQLICLARALLRKSKILVLDEATAAVDLETDDLIQETIRREFASYTILTIAHRLNTIMDSTRIMVLSDGRIAEFDPPSVLLERKESIFYGMAKDAKLI